MGDSKSESDPLRKRAEQLLRLKLSDDLDVSGMSATEITELIHDLQVSQIELGLRNKELQCTVGLKELARSAHDRDYPSKAMRSVMKMARKAVRSDVPVLLIGERGSGKGHLAEYIHRHSNRAEGSYTAFDCTDITPELAESILFGRNIGQLTGTEGKTWGLLKECEGGTLLLKEIEDLTLEVQSRLLEFLDSRKFARSGGEKEISANTRVIAAGTRDIGQLVAAGDFNKDLFERLNVLPIRVPPLRERREDIPILVKEITEELQQEMQIHSNCSINSFIVEGLQKYGWPGNVTELRSVLRYYLPSRGRHVKSICPRDTWTDDGPDG